MKLYEHISLLSTIVWLIVPLFYYKSKHFLFFLLMGLSDLTAGVLWFGYGLSSQTILIPIKYLIVLSIDKEFFFRKKNVIFLGFVIVSILNYYSTTNSQYIFGLFANAIILTVFVKYLYWEFIKRKKINIFYAIMVFYSLFSLYKSILLISSVQQELSEYFVGTIIQIVIGIYLLFIKRDVWLSSKSRKA